MNSYDNFYVSFGDPSREHFEVSDVWIEFYDGTEVDNISDVPVDWLDGNLIKPSLNSECPPLYSLLPTMDPRKYKFLIAAAKFHLGGQFDRFDGYLFLVDGAISSIGIFISETVLHLYCSELLVEDNIKGLNFLGLESELKNANDFSLEYKRRSRINIGIDDTGVVAFPLIERK